MRISVIHGLGKPFRHATGMASGLALLLALPLAVVPLGAVIAAPAAPVAPLPAAVRGPDGFADLADRLLPMVVNISTTQTLRRSPDEEPLPELPEGSPLDDFFKNFTDRGNTPRRVTSLGSGFIIDPAGIVVTNNHVIEGADEISVILSDHTTLPAKLLGRDDKTDLAVLKVNPRKPLPSAKLGDSDRARVGQWVVAIGNPFGLGGSVTAGIISARNRDISSGPYDDFIQTDAPINRGNSGGPLFNMQGEVIGINSAIYSPTGGSVGIGFSIPSNEAKTVVAQLRTGKVMQRGWLGVRIQEVSEEIAEGMGLESPRGALIAGITPNGPAAKAGIQNGDVVMTFDGKPVADNRTLPRLVAEAAIGKRVNVEVIRKGARKVIPVTVQRLVDDEKAATPAKAAPKKGAPAKPQIANLGLSFGVLNAQARTRYRIGKDVQGVLVTDVDADSPAGQKNIRPGDVIAEVAQQKVTMPDQVSALIDAERRAGHKVVLLEVSRGGELTFIGVRLP